MPLGKRSELMKDPGRFFDHIAKRASRIRCRRANLRADSKPSPQQVEEWPLEGKWPSRIART